MVPNPLHRCPSISSRTSVDRCCQLHLKKSNGASSAQHTWLREKWIWLHATSIHQGNWKNVRSSGNVLIQQQFTWFITDECEYLFLMFVSFPFEQRFSNSFIGGHGQCHRQSNRLFSIRIAGIYLRFFRAPSHDRNQSPSSLRAISSSRIAICLLVLGSLLFACVHLFLLKVKQIH